VKRLVELGRLDEARAKRILHAMDDVERTPGSFVVTPTLLNIIARKRDSSVSNGTR
jgi:hypothetical protein